MNFLRAKPWAAMAHVEGCKGEELLEVLPPEADQIIDQPPADTEQEGIVPNVEYC